MRLNFAVEITELPDGRFRISVESPIGEISADAANPFSAEDLSRYERTLNPQTPNISSLDREATARELGSRLFSFIFDSSPQILAAYYTSLDRAGHHGLRLLLTVEKAGALSRLHWELLRDPQRDFLTLSRSTPIVRYTKQLTLRPPVTIEQPLRVLVVVSSPTDVPPLDVEAEWTRLVEATAGLRERGLLALERLERATLIDLQRKLRMGEYHVLHIIGHSDFDARGDQGVLVFEKPDGSAQVITAPEFGREIGEESTIRLVVLNSCRSATRPIDESIGAPLMGIASNLVTRGIPAVVAMQYPISDRAAQVFSEEFYRALAEFIPIDAAVSEARRAIANQLRNTEWFTPVLFMRTDEGVLFKRDPAAAPEPQGFQLSRQVMTWIGIIGVAIILFGLLLILQPDPVPVPPTETPSPTPTVTPTQTPTGDRADLQVSRVRISPSRPAPGQLVQINVTFTNSGTADSGAFSYAWDADSTDPTMLNAFVGSVPNIPPGASRSLIFPYSFGWWGTYNSQFVVDALSEVSEISELNNRFPFAIVVPQEFAFDVDFTLLPDLTFVDPPQLMPADAYADWSLDFALSEACASVDLTLIEVASSIALTHTAAAGDPCETSPLTVQFTRQPLSSVQVELLPLQDGTLTLSYFSDLEGQTLLQTEQHPLSQGVAARHSITDVSIRRIEISADQRIQLTRLTMLPDTNP